MYPCYPVEVHWANLRHYADTSFDEERKRFVIRLSRRRVTTWAELVDTMVHEWAHVLTWYSWCREHHGPEWGIAFARCYRMTEKLL